MNYLYSFYLISCAIILDETLTGLFKISEYLILENGKDTNEVSRTVLRTRNTTPTRCEIIGIARVRIELEIRTPRECGILIAHQPGVESTVSHHLGVVCENPQCRGVVQGDPQFGSVNRPGVETTEIYCKTKRKTKYRASIERFKGPYNYRRDGYRSCRRTVVEHNRSVEWARRKRLEG